MTLARICALVCGAGAATLLILVDAYIGPQANPRPTQPGFFLIVVVAAASIGGWAARFLRRPIDDLIRATRATERASVWPSLTPGAPHELHDLNRALADSQERNERVVQSLAEERFRFQGIFDSMTEAILVTDEQGRIVLTNRALTDLFGIDDTNYGLRPEDVIRSAAICESVDEVLVSRLRVASEVPLPGVTPRHLDVRVAPIVDEDRLVGSVTVLYDITNLRRLERTRADFVANVSHELRTPLTAIRGSAETLADGALEDRDAAGRFVAVINSHAKRLTNLLDDLLDLSRLESDELQIDVHNHALASLIEAAHEAVEETRQGKRIEIQVQLEDPSTSVRCDRQLIEQTLINLMDNAIKYTPEDGRIAIRTYRAEREHVAGELLKHDLALGVDAAQNSADALFIEVTDSGIGIPPDVLDRVFERFYRVDKGRSREMGGTGLGLAIVRHALSLHGEHVFVDSSPGSGSTFGFTLAVD